MSVEPGLADTNVLIYALDADAPHHTAARALVEAARDGSAMLYVTPQILCEFYAVVTNARRVAKPRSPAEALDAISDLLKFLHVLPIPAHAVDGWMSLVRLHPVTGADVFDLQIVATMRANDVQRIYTFNIQLWRHEGGPPCSLVEPYQIGLGDRTVSACCCSVGECLVPSTRTCRQAGSDGGCSCPT